MRRLKVLTCHTHGSYLHYLSHAPHDFNIRSKPGHPPGYGGRCGSVPWRANVDNLPAELAREHAFDCILFQDNVDRFSIGRFSSDWNAALRRVTGPGATRQEKA